MTTEVEMYLDIHDRVRTLLYSLELDYNRFRNSMKATARQIGKEFSLCADETGVITVNYNMLTNAVRACYLTAYTSIVSETNNHTNLVEAVKEFPFEDFPKIDIFIFSKATPEKILAHVIVDVFPSDIGYVPFLDIRKTLNFVSYERLTMQ